MVNSGGVSKHEAEGWAAVTLRDASLRDAPQGEAERSRRSARLFLSVVPAARGRTVKAVAVR
jgi:hypothetical protein